MANFVIEVPHKSNFNPVEGPVLFYHAEFYDCDSSKIKYIYPPISVQGSLIQITLAYLCSCVPSVSIRISALLYKKTKLRFLSNFSSELRILRNDAIEVV